MSEFEEYIKVNYPRDYERQKRIYPDQSVEELYSEDYKMWQHQQAIIDSLKAQLNNMETCYIEKKKQVEAVEHVLGCAMIGPKEVFQYADRIGKALRGDNA